MDLLTVILSSVLLIILGINEFYIGNREIS